MSDRRSVWVRWIAVELAALAVLAALVVRFQELVGTWPESGAVAYRIYPDGAELAWLAHAFAEGHSPLLPLANELHPTRYPIVHPSVASLWIRMRGWDPGVMREYALVAMIAGAALLYLWLWVARFSVVARVIALAAVLNLPVAIEAARNLMQDPTMFPLFAAGGLAWALASRALERNARSPLGLLAMLAVGILWGGVAGMRITGALLLAVPAISISRRLGCRRAVPALALEAVGVAAVIGALVLHTWRFAGLTHVAGYSHWDPGFFGEHFSLLHPLDNPHLHWTPMLVLMGRAWWGLDASLTNATWVGVALTLMGLDLAVRLRSSRMRLEAVLLAGFAASVVVIHLFYDYFMPRFFLVPITAMIIAGVAGWDAATRALWARAGAGRVGASALAAAVALGLSGLWRAPPEVGELATPQEVTEVRRHRLFGRLARRLDCPVFVDRLSLLAMRLHWGLFDWPRPIAPLTHHHQIFIDGNTPWFLTDRIRPARGHLDDPSLWPVDPARSHLIGEDGRVVDDGRIERLVDAHGRIAVYGPAWRDDAMPALISWAETHGFTVRDASHDPMMRMLVVERAD